MAGIPNNNEFITGDNIAVIKPTLRPYLYDANNVKKYIGKNILPPFGIR